jgi:hypothetical protein
VLRWTCHETRMLMVSSSHDRAHGRNNRTLYLPVPSSSASRRCQIRIPLLAARVMRTRSPSVRSRARLLTAGARPSLKCTLPGLTLVSSRKALTARRVPVSLGLPMRCSTPRSRSCTTDWYWLMHK